MGKKYSKGGIISSIILSVSCLGSFGHVKSPQTLKLIDAFLLFIPVAVLLWRSFSPPLDFKKGFATYVGSLLLSAPLHFFASLFFGIKTLNEGLYLLIYLPIGFILLRYGLQMSLSSMPVEECGKTRDQSIENSDKATPTAAAKQSEKYIEQIDVNKMLENFNANDIDLRRKTIIEAGKDRIREAIDQLLSILLNNDENDNLRCCAATALGMIGDTKAVEPLINTLKSAKSWELRDRSASALGAIGDERATEPLKQAQHDIDFHVVDAANNALLKLDVKNTVADLIDNFNHSKTLTDNVWIIAANLGDAANKLGAPEARTLSQLCLSTLKSNDTVRFCAICANKNLDKIFDHNALQEDKSSFIELLTAALDHSDYKIRGSAAEALGITVSENANLKNREQIIDKLILMLEDTIFDVRRKTVISLCWYIKDPKAIIPLQKAAEKAGDSKGWILQQISQISGDSSEPVEKTETVSDDECLGCKKPLRPEKETTTTIKHRADVAVTGGAIGGAIAGALIVWGGGQYMSWGTIAVFLFTMMGVDKDKKWLAGIVFASIAGLMVGILK